MACGLQLGLHTSKGKSPSQKELTVVAPGWGRGRWRAFAVKLLSLCLSYLVLFDSNYTHPQGFPNGSEVENLPAMQETQAQSLGWDYPLEKSLATHSSTLARRIPMDRGA